MKRITLTIYLALSSIISFGQSLFFDNLNNSTWKSEAYYNDSTIRNSKQIGLGKVAHNTDALKVNVTIWKFKDGSLTINYYDCHLKKDSLVATYRYEPYADKGILKIILRDNKALEFDVGIISTGNYSTLTRKNKKKKK